jgi:sugar phosphate isomerase/epimerase
MKLGIRLESLGLPLRKAIQEASRMGAAGVQADAMGDLSPEQMTQTGRREFRNLLRSLDLELLALNCPLRRGLDKAENLQPRIEHVREVMSLSYDLGPRMVVVEMPPIPDDKPIAPPTPTLSPGGLILGAAPSAEDPAKLLRESLTDLGSHGDRTGTTLALECGVDPADKLASYLDSFHSGGLAVSYDPANMLMNGHDPIAGLSALHAKIAHVYARDARKSSASRTTQEVPLGAGDIDWMTFVAVLDTINYRGWLTVRRESGQNRVGDVENGLALLRRFVRPG